MNTIKIVALTLAAVLTAGSLILWQATGGDYYTKFEVVQEIQEEIDPEDPLAAAGFYENETVTKTVTTEGLRLGLLPAPRGILDKHAFSVATIVVPAWALALLILWLSRKKKILPADRSQN